MKVTKAKTAGFCFGVNRAVDMTTTLAKSGKKVATMGPLIHNHQAIEALEKLGVITMDSLDAPEGYEVVLRSHGVEKNVYEYFESRGIITHDAACPYVKKIHRLAEKTGKDALEAFQEALDNIMPVLEVKARRVGGATYQVPMEVRPDRRQTLGLRWLTRYSRERNEKTMKEDLQTNL